MKICLINKYYLPDKGITARSAADLVEYLQLSGHEVHTVSTFSAYGKVSTKQINENKNHKVQAVYNGKNKILRLLGSCLENMSLIRKAIRLDADIYIVMTSPPLLNYFAGRRFRKKKKDWIYWSLDLYPEAFKSNGLVSASNKLYRFILNQSYAYSPVYLLELGKQQGVYIQKAFGKKIPSSLIPCGAFAMSKDKKLIRNTKPNWKKQPGKTYFAYIGNLGEAHSLEFLKSFLDALDDTKHRLVLTLYGSKAADMLAYSKDNPIVEVVDFIPVSEFDAIDVHLASLLPDWVDVCVPSKLVSAVCKGVAFLYYGSENSDSWQYLGSAGWLIDCQYNMQGQIQILLNELDKEKIQLKKEVASALGRKIEQQILEGYKNLDDFLKSK